MDGWMGGWTDKGMGRCTASGVSVTIVLTADRPQLQAAASLMSSLMSEPGW